MGRRKRHTAEQIAAILKQQEAGLKVSDICRKLGISEQSASAVGHRVMHIESM